MRGVGVNPVDVVRTAVFFSFIDRTFTEAAEQTPRPRAGSAQAAGATNDHAEVASHTPIADKSWRLRVCGADGPRHFYPCRGDAPDTRDVFVKPGSERPFYTTVHR
jgi:hypothetical protein